MKSTNVGQHGAFLGELRQLAKTWPDDVEVREHWAVALYNSMHGAMEEGSAALHDQLLVELRRLAYSYPADVHLREPLSKGLYIAMNYARELGNFEVGDRLFDGSMSYANCPPLKMLEILI